MPDIDFWNALTAIIGIVVSVAVARFYGDLAGQKAAQKYEEKKAQKACVSALRALVAQVELAQDIAQANIGANTGTGIPRVPTGAFEIAFVSAMPRLDGSPDLIDAVSEYLSRAYAVNSLIDQYLGYLGGPGGTPAAERALPNIKGTCATLPPVMDRLGARLQDELDHSSV